MSYEFSLIADTASSIALEVMNKILEKNKYQPSKTSDWIDAIGSGVITEMRKVSPNFKYIISCIISQKVGSGLHYESVAHWDASTDGSITSKYENESMIVLCSVIAIAI